MRRFDKTKNIRKANLLAEQRYLESKGLIKESTGHQNSVEFVKSMNPPNLASYQGIQNLDNTINVQAYLDEVRKNADGEGRGASQNAGGTGVYLGDDVFSYLKRVLLRYIEGIQDIDYRNWLKNPEENAKISGDIASQVKKSQEFINSIPDKSPTYIQNSESFEKHIETPFIEALKEITKNNYYGFELILLPHLAHQWKRFVIGKTKKEI